jgi:hypothetical protein
MLTGWHAHTFVSMFEPKVHVFIFSDLTKMNRREIQFGLENIIKQVAHYQNSHPHHSYKS